MIELAPAEHDDPGFLSLAERIVNGAVAVLELRDVFVVHVDSWFDHKWLRWRSSIGKELRAPTFTPNRVLSEKRFVWDVDQSTWTLVGPPRPLHVHQPGRTPLARQLDQYSKRAAFVWYSASTAMNKVGSLMFYVTGAEGYAWYATLKKVEQWAVADEFQTTRRELLTFEERGRHLDVAEA